MDSVNRENSKKEWNPYQTRQGLECLNSCIYNFLINDNQTVSQSDIFFAGGGYDIRYSWGHNVHNIKSMQNRSNFKFIETYLTESIIENVLETDDGEMKNFINQMVSEKHKFIINVSSSNLPYNKAFDSSNIVTHFINLIGVDTKNNMVKISDGCAPVTGGGCFEDWLDIENITENWQRMNGRYIELNYGQIDIRKIKQQAYENMMKGIKKYLHRDKAIFKSSLSGHQAILRLFEDIQEMIRYNPENSLAIIREINRQLRVEGYISSKWFLLEKMRELNCDEASISAYEGLIYEYDMICLNAMKCVIKKKPELMDKVLEQVSRSVRIENEILEKVILYVR